MSTATDWNAYYAKPVATASVTRRITRRLLVSLLEKYGPTSPRQIWELGGANSCVFDAVHARFPDARYVAVDNNAFGLQLLAERWGPDSRMILRNEDVRTIVPDGERADIVFSIGLIEHFAPGDTARVIARHFALLAPGGLAVITFPTPTWLYRTTRAVAELFGTWRFPDERPLLFREVLNTVESHASVIRAFVNWPIVLTQGIIVARKHR